VAMGVPFSRPSDIHTNKNALHYSLFSAPHKLFLKTSFYTETMEILLMKIGQIEKLKGNLN
jgi:hypothetical protein